MPSIVDLLGNTLIGSDRNQVETATLLSEGKIVGLYFSAHWCPPCRKFTTKLTDFYNNHKQSHNDQLEIVFVSSDRDETSFLEHFSEMPWLGLPFVERDYKVNTSQITQSLTVTHSLH